MNVIEYSTTIMGEVKESATITDEMKEPTWIKENNNNYE